MKILTNSQDKAVGGIVRMMNTFVESVLETNPSVSFYFVIASSGKDLKVTEKKTHQKMHYGFSSDCLVLSSDFYPEVIRRSKSLKDLKSDLSVLVDFYLESIRKSKPDVILINGTYYRPWALLQAARQMNVPYVVYVHGSVVREGQGLPSSVFLLLTEMEKDFYDEDARYIFPSSVALNGVLFSSRIQPGQSHIISNSLESSFFIRKSLQTENQESIGFVLRWESVKNTDFILDFIKFNKNSPKPYRIKVVSDLSAENLQQYQDEFTDFLQPKTKKEMVEFYQEVDAVINPSFFETFGYVPAEAVAGGTPAIISSAQGISEVFLKCGLERLIFDFKNVSTVHEKIHDIIKRGVSSKEIEKLRNELDPVRLSKNILSVLSEAVNN